MLCLHGDNRLKLRFIFQVELQNRQSDNIICKRRGFYIVLKVEDLLELETPDCILAVLAVDDHESLTEVENILEYLKYKQFLETQVYKRWYLYRVTYKRWDFRDDCTEFNRSFLLHSWFPKAVIFSHSLSYYSVNSVYNQIQ